MRAWILASAFVAVAGVSTSARAAGPEIAMDLYLMAGELDASSLTFDGVGIDGNGAKLPIHATGSQLGFLGGTYYGAGFRLFASALDTRFGSLLLGGDIGGGMGGIVAAPRNTAYPPTSFSVAHVTLDAGWGISSRSFFMAYGMGFGFRLMELSLSGLNGTDSSGDDNGSPIESNSVYTTLWLRPAYVFFPGSEASGYIGGSFLVDPLNLGTREYGLTIGLVAR